MSNGLLIGEDERVAAWAFSKFNLHPTRVDRGFGIIDSKKILKGVVLLQNFNGSNIELSYYGPNTLSLGIVKAIARAIIIEFKATRLTVVTSKHNKRLIRSILRFGFKLEGTQRCYYGLKDCNRNTGVRFVLFQNEISKIAGVCV